MPYENYLDYGIQDLDDILEAYREYSNGGFWVKKIDKKDGFYREIVIGPYKEKKANEMSKEWNDFFHYKNFKTAEVFSLTELLCNTVEDQIDKLGPKPKKKGPEMDAYMKKLRAIKKNKKKTGLSTKLEHELYEEHIWQPPIGSKLFCILKEYLKTDIQESEIMNNRVFKKFWEFTSCSGVDKIEVNDKLIFYNKRNAKSYNEAIIIKKIMIEFMEEPEQMEWLISYIRKTKKRGIKPIIIPDFIKNTNSCMPITLEFFKENFVSRRGLKYAYNKLNKCMNDEEKKAVGGVNSIETRLNISFLINSKDYKVKKLYFTKVTEDNYQLKFSDLEDNFSLELNDIKDHEGFMKVRLPEDKESWALYSSKTDGDSQFANFDSTMALFLYICKTLAIHKIELKDERQKPCVCYETQDKIYVNIINLLAGKKDIYYKLGFRLKHEKDYMTIIDKYKKENTRKFLGLPEKKTKLDDDFFLDKTVGEVAKLYLEGYCEYDKTCDMINHISDKIYEEIGYEKHYYHLNLQKTPIEYYRKKF